MAATVLASQLIQSPLEGGYPQVQQAQRKKAQHKPAPASAKQKTQAKVAAKPAGLVTTSLTTNASLFTPGSLTMQAVASDSSLLAWLGGPQGPPGTFAGHQAVSSVGRNRFSTKFMPHQLCSHYTGQGWCRKAEQCTFAHGTQELHPEVAAMYMQPQASLGSSARAMLEARGAAFLQQQQQQSMAQSVLSQDYTANGIEVASMPIGTTSSLGPSIIGTTTSLGQMRTEAPVAVADSAEGFKFNLDAAPFVAGAQMKFNSQAAPFVPTTQPKMAKVVSIAKDEPDADDDTSPPGIASESSTLGLTLPIGRRSPRSSSDEQSPSAASRMVPAPLTLGEGMTPSSRRVSVVSPTSVSSRRASLLVGTPTSAVQARILSSQALSPRGTPTARMTPKAALSPSATMFDRSTLLQARTVAKKLEQGPPGLGMCAPTPKSEARAYGFQFPQPGYISSRRFSLSTSLPPPTGERTTERRTKLKANAPWHRPGFG